MTRDELIDLGTEALIELRTVAWIAPEELMLARRDARAVIDALVKAGVFDYERTDAGSRPPGR